MNNCVLDTIAARRSHRAYAATPVSEEQLQALLHAALQAPSAVNRQPWHFTVVRDQALLQAISDETAAQRQKKAAQDRSPRFADPQYHVFYHAPLVIFISANPAWRYSALDSGIAVQNIALAAESMGLGTVILGMPFAAFEGEKAQEFAQALHFLPGEEFMIAIAIGVPTDDKPAHEESFDHVSYAD